MATLPSAAATASRSKASYAKPVLWALLGMTGITVLIFTDYPIFFHPNPDRTRLFKEWFLLFPHALAGVIATAIGPFQFSTRLRARNLPLHRLLGKIYVGCIFVAAPLVIALSLKAHPLMLFVGYVFSIIWFSSTLFALLTARNGHVQAHRRWMIRSYAFTLDFIFSRALNPVPSFASMSAPTFAYTLMFLAVLYLFIPDVYLSWKEITTKRRT